MIILGRISPGWKVLLSVLSISLICSMLSVYVSIKAAERSTEQRLRAEQVARDLQRRVTCDLTARILAGYAEVPPSTPAGKNVMEAWREEYRALGCKNID
jgi:hypothetical protein